jgi:hypothetical protein
MVVLCRRAHNQRRFRMRHDRSRIVDAIVELTEPLSGFAIQTRFEKIGKRNVRTVQNGRPF